MKKIMLLACLLAGKFALSQSTPKADPGIGYAVQKTAVTAEACRDHSARQLTKQGRTHAKGLQRRLHRTLNS